MSIKCNIVDLQSLFKEVFEFLVNTDVESLSQGRYYLDNGIYANVDEYTTKSLNEAVYESHKKYIDIQMLIDGNEDIYVKDIDELSNVTKYDLEKDITFYKNDINAKKYEMKEKECLVLYPQDGHMPCVNENKTNNKKIVFKIPLAYIKDIKCLIMDVDGTLTDGKIYMGSDSELCKAFSAKDGYGIANILKTKDIVPVIITGRQSKIVENRANELGIKDVYQGIGNKVVKINEVVSKLNIALSNVAYIGDDNNDLSCIEYINESSGLTACPKNASNDVLAKANFISQYNGGDGAVRELIDWICNGK